MTAALMHCDTHRRADHGTEIVILRLVPRRTDGKATRAESLNQKLSRRLARTPGVLGTAWSRTEVQAVLLRTNREAWAIGIAVSADVGARVELDLLEQDSGWQTAFDVTGRMASDIAQLPADLRTARPARGFLVGQRP